MAFWGDYHTHTTYSRRGHGKGTIEQNVQRAISLGLKEIAITDHGFEHRSFNVRRCDWEKIRKDQLAVQERYPQIKIYLGIEANIQSLRGDLDLKDHEVAKMDLIVAGYHKFAKPAQIKDDGYFYLPNFFAGLGWGTSKGKSNLRAKNTDAFIKAIERYPIDIISHPQAGCDLDIYELAKAAAHYGTYLELNGKRIKTTDAEFEKILADTTVEFVADSDAHEPLRVGECALPLATIERVPIPKSRLANWERLPAFRSQKNRYQTLDKL